MQLSYSAHVISLNVENNCTPEVYPYFVYSGIYYLRSIYVEIILCQYKAIIPCKMSYICMSVCLWFVPVGNGIVLLRVICILILSWNTW